MSLARRYHAEHDWNERGSQASTSMSAGGSATRYLDRRPGRAWHIGPDAPAAPHPLAFNGGLHTWEAVVVVRKGATYGYPRREGVQAMTTGGMTC